MSAAEIVALVVIAILLVAMGLGKSPFCTIFTREDDRYE